MPKLQQREIDFEMESKVAWIGGLPVCRAVKRLLWAIAVFGRRNPGRIGLEESTEDGEEWSCDPSKAELAAIAKRSRSWVQQTLRRARSEASEWLSIIEGGGNTSSIYFVRWAINRVEKYPGHTPVTDRGNSEKYPGHTPVTDRGNSPPYTSSEVLTDPPPPPSGNWEEVEVEVSRILVDWPTALAAVRPTRSPGDVLAVLAVYREFAAELGPGRLHRRLVHWPPGLGPDEGWPIDVRRLRAERERRREEAARLGTVADVEAERRATWAAEFERREREFGAVLDGLDEAAVEQLARRAGPIVVNAVRAGIDARPQLLGQIEREEAGRAATT